MISASIMRVGIQDEPKHVETMFHSSYEVEITTVLTIN